MSNAKRLRSRTHNKSPQTTKAAMKKILSERIVIETTEEGIYLVVDGVRMAKRGKAGTSEEETWIYLNPSSPERQG